MVTLTRGSRRSGGARRGNMQDARDLGILPTGEIRISLSRSCDPNSGAAHGTQIEAI